MSRSLRRLTPDTALFAALFLPLCASATEWFIEPLLTVGFERHDNLAITEPKSGNVMATTFSPQINFITRQLNWEARATAQTRRANYSEDRYDNDTGTATLTGRYNTQRNLWQLDASAVNDSLVTNEQIDPDTGTLRGHRKRATRMVSPAWTYSLQEDSQIKLSLQGLTVSYDDGESVSLYEYEQRGGNAQYVWNVSELTKLYVAAGQFIYKVPTLQYESTTRSARLGLSRLWTETLSTDIAAGRRRTTSEGQQQVCSENTLDLRIFGIGCYDPLAASVVPTIEAVITDTNDGTTLNASLSERFELILLSINLSRSLDPTGSGTQTETDEAQIRIERPLVAGQLTTSLTLERRIARAIGGNSALVNREYEAFTPRLRWLVTRDWAIETTYRHSRLKYESVPESISSNSVYVTFGYSWPKISLFH